LDGIVKRTVVERARKERDVGNDYVTITYRDEDPRRAAAFANKLREVWIEETIGAIRDDVQRQLDEAKRQYEKSYKDYMIATQNVQRWQEQYGLSPVNPTNRKVTSEEDPVRKEYLQAKQDLTRAESEMNRHFDIYTAARDRFASEPLEIEEPIDERTAAASPQFDSTRALLDQVKSLKDDITRLKAEQTKLKPQHKQFGLKQQDIDAKGKELKELEQQLAKAGLSTNGDKPMTRKVLNAAKLAAKEEVARTEADYKTRKNEYESIKDKVAELEIQSQRRAFIYTRYNQYQNDEDYFKNQYLDAKKLTEKRTTLLDQLRTAAMNPYKILDEAVPSEKPVEPPVLLYLIGGLIGGGGATIALTFLRELARSGYRSVQDASSSLSLPVLGYVNRMETRAELHGARRRQVLGIATSLTAILFVCGTASLYLLQPKLLPTPMKQALDTVKRNLK
jgi:capsular polysaccharide biosynthesis protein